MIGANYPIIGPFLRFLSSVPPHSPLFIILTIIFEAGILGCGSYVMFVKVCPFFSRREDWYEFSNFSMFWMQAERDGIPFIGVPRRLPIHPLSLYISYLLKGTTFLLLFGVQAILLTSIGWHDPFSWTGLRYDLLFARAGKDVLNGAHLVSYLPIPALGLYAAWKFRADVLLECYLGLLLAALAVAIHEGFWIVFYYAFYWQYLSWGVLDNVIKDVFFCVMLGLFVLTYERYPFQKIPLKTFKWPTIIYVIVLIVWATQGFHITTINNFVYGKGIYGITQWWGDTETNLFEVLSWDILVVGMIITVALIPNERGIMLSVSKDPLRNENNIKGSKPTVGVMVSVIHAILRRVEIPAWVEDRIKEGYNKGSWEHIKQSDKVHFKAWKAKEK